MTNLQRLLSDPANRAAVCKRLKVHRSTVYRWQTGKRFPERRQVPHLRALFPGLSLDDIYTPVKK